MARLRTPDLPSCGRRRESRPGVHRFSATPRDANVPRTANEEPDPPRPTPAHTRGPGHDSQARAADEQAFTPPGSCHRTPAPRHAQFSRWDSRAHQRGPAPGGPAQDRGPAERDLQQRQLLEHRHRREGRHPDLQRRRRADAGLHGRRSDEQDHAGRHLRSAGSDRARQGAERRARHPDHAGLRGAGLQGLARHRGHLRADLHPQGRQPLPGGRVGHGAARRAGRHHRLPADRHRQHRAQAGRRGAAQGRAPCRARSSTAPTSRASPPTPRASSRSSTSAPSGCWATRPPR